VRRDEFLEKIISQASELPGGWVKLITHEAQNLTTGEKRDWQQVSLRPYLQGYGCDGSTDLNIHALTHCFCARLGLSYPQLMVAAYPQENAPARDFGWLEDDLILAETFIPPEIDPVLVLADLVDINNYTLASLLERELVRLGLVSEGWHRERGTPAFDKRIRKIRDAYCLAASVSGKRVESCV